MLEEQLGAFRLPSGTGQMQQAPTLRPVLHHARILNRQHTSPWCEESPGESHDNSMSNRTTLRIGVSAGVAGKKADR